VVFALSTVPAAPQTDPLRSWNEGPAKAAILDFVARVTTEGTRDFVLAAERIAVFDNDGTLSVEQPLPAQVAFELACVGIVGPDHPEWSSTQPFKAAVERDADFLGRLGERGFAEIMLATHVGWSTDDYETTLYGWLWTTPHERFKRPYTQLVYQPMLEVLSYFEANGFKNYIVSGNSRDFMLPWVEKVFGVSPERVIGSSIKTKFEILYGNATLTRLPEINFVDDGAGRPPGIHERIRARPIAAFGNSDGDFEMLQWTTMGVKLRLGVLVHHTDAEREYGYDRDAGFGRLDKALDAAAENKWAVVDMKSDWKVIFPFETQ
jgi:hypothetical protein